MIRIRAHAAQLSLNDVWWPLRGFAEWCHAMETTYLRDSGLRRAVKVAVDFCCGVLAVAIAVALVEGIGTIGVRETAGLAVAVGCFLVASEALSGSYRTIWRYTSLAEAIALALCGFLILAGLLMARWLELLTVSPATILLAVLLMLFGCVGVRGLRRWQVAQAKVRTRNGRHAPAPAQTHRILIAGAGEHGRSISRELRRSRPPGVELVGFLDDDPAKLGGVLNGAPVLGPLAEVLSVAERCHANEVLVAMPSIDPGFVRSFVRKLEDSGIKARAVRGIRRFVTGGDLYRPGNATLDELLEGAGLGGTANGKANGTGNGTGNGNGNGNGNGKHHAVRNGAHRVLVTGGAGFIGSHLTRMLLDRGYHVRVLDRFAYGRSGLAGLQHPRLEVFEGDICNSRDLGHAVRGVEGVIALAAIVGDPACNLDPEETINLNYTATKMLIEACSFYGVRRLVFASSCSVYGASSNALLTERSRLNPVSLYARTRILSENIIFDRRGDVEPVVLRLSTVFGLSPRMRFDLVVNTLTAQALVDKRISIFGGNQWRPNVHCRDAARAFILALEAPASAVAGEIFNVGGDTLNHRIGDLGSMVGEIVRDVTVVRKDEVTDARDYRVGFDKIRHVLGFEPQFSVADGIREIAAAMSADPQLQRYRDPLFHNVQALQRDFQEHPLAPELVEA